MTAQKHNVLRHSAIAIALAAATFSGMTYAQEAAQTDTPTQDVERVVITGSRIARDVNLASSSPIQSVSTEEIKSSGEFNIVDVMNDVPALFSSTTTGSANANNGEAFAAGANILSLRGLGANRTLVLVNGKRHVGGAQGSSAVDIGSIPSQLIKSVEVLTGGASAVYGADAVTGVVNFILEDSYEGFEFDARVGQSSEGDAQQFVLATTFGENFDNDRGNVAISIEYAKDDGLRASQRDGGVFIGSGRDWVNPAKRFQQGDISGDMPNFANYYSPANDRVSFGLAVPGSAEEFVSLYQEAFGSAPNLTQSELSYIAAAAAAPQRAVLPGRTFPFTSGYGYIVPGNAFTFAGFDAATPIDLDNNGVPDCYDSFTGYNSSFAADAFGALGGCWNVTEDGNYRPVQDGLVANGFQGFYGDSFNTIQQQDSWLLIPEEKININLLSRYDLTDDVTLYGELKYAMQEVENGFQPTSFWDLLLGAPDNPFLPDFIRPVAEQTGGVGITIDPIGIGEGNTKTERDTLRIVGGIRGYMENGWNYELSAVYGKFKRESTRYNSVVVDRFMAAIDAVIDPATGNPACRADVDPNAPAMGTPFNIPDYDPGYFTFTPGAGQCVPLNIWAGRTGITQEAVDWVTVTERDQLTLEQTVLSATLAGDLSEYFELPAGPIAFAMGGEYRKEESTATFDPWQRGVLPEGSAFTAGTNVADYSGNTKLTFRPMTTTRNERGGYEVTEVFGEVSIPLLYDAPLASELTLDLAARYSDYTTIGTTTTWLAKVVWAPFEDLRIRANISEAVRAPNVTELFGPEVGTTFRPADPCDAAQIQALRENGLVELANNTQANCVADFATIGLDPFDDEGNYAFSDPLSAAFGGLTGGNPDLQEETAETTTIGFVYTPEFVEGLSISVDYWDIQLDDAVNAISDQNIADGCYQGNSLNPQFCELLARNSDPDSIFYGGFNFMKSTSINFAKRETSGYDFTLDYQFEVDKHRFEFGIAGTKVDELNDFNNPLDLTDVDPELGEIRRPELAGNVTLQWQYENLTVGWQGQYVDEMLLAYVEIETAQALYGDAVFMDDMWIHDLNARYVLDDNLEVYGGINNVTDEEPFITNYAYPVSARGRYVFMGFNVRM
ncbi:TonB-dependent receptor [Aestuariibacter halophilus]|uniref:TonB-dependent receptor n=1 Tax=Fluctibacter halophilus TaxID=226011 RepID=A0ABS8G9Z5_9ALTE|nr:TonB-dependent receptor [Aestuariibacter halophilus]MCC2617333.1 TonB-dependent receptor [Aestuariibacter halophilus]